ncbi:MAG TPA: helix-turn-helix transcriptional regulator [Longimicrobium sp.]|jgi:AraC-like DNA-binding protein
MPQNPDIAAALQRFRLANAPATNGVSWHVRALMAEINESLFDQRLTVNTLKARCRIRDNNIAYHFKDETGVSIKEYIERLRIAAAGELLRSGNFNAWEVAHAVGYSHLQTFYRAFRRRFGCTPGDFRVRVKAPHEAVREAW